jgi:hypothetical protein
MRTKMKPLVRTSEALYMVLVWCTDIADDRGVQGHPEASEGTPIKRVKPKRKCTTLQEQPKLPSDLCRNPFPPGWELSREIPLVIARWHQRGIESLDLSTWTKSFVGDSPRIRKPAETLSSACPPLSILGTVLDLRDV